MSDYIPFPTRCDAKIWRFLTPITRLEYVDDTPPQWALDIADLLRELQEGIESGSPEARSWAVAQLDVLARAFGNPR